jgi:hypothetical protein
VSAAGALFDGGGIELPLAPEGSSWIRHRAERLIERFVPPISEHIAVVLFEQTAQGPT